MLRTQFLLNFQVEGFRRPEDNSYYACCYRKNSCKNPQQTESERAISLFSDFGIRASRDLLSLLTWIIAWYVSAIFVGQTLSAVITWC